jgi:hypothetical protein
VMGYTRKQAQGVASDIQFGQIRDGVAAWVLVKVRPTLSQVGL